jgi:thiol-disulfide isomerase/thioredoxin
MEEQQKKIFFIVLGVLAIGLVGVGFLQSKAEPAGPGKYDEFATCLKDKGAVFYGAFWCPHCQAQKKLFGKSAKLLPYVECSTADASGQTQACIDKGVNSYPTWEFADGSRLNGEIPLAQLAEKTSCVLPVE